MTMRTKMIAAAGLVAAAMVPAVAQAQTTTIASNLNGATWEASNRIVGTTSTGTIPAGAGNPIYQPVFPRDSSIVSLSINYGPGQNFICSGTLAGNGRSVVTAAHCVTQSFALTAPVSVTAHFYGGTNPDAIVAGNAQSVAIAVSQITVNPNYTGQVIDQNDIAVLTLATAAPAFASVRQVGAFRDVTGEGFTQFGYGGRGAGGATGATFGTGRLRQGDNTIDARLGDPAFGGFFTNRNAAGFNFFDNPAGPSATIDHVYLSDFDSGLAANDAGCIVLGVCNLGVGARESNTAGGDSGGPQFINGRLASVTSFGLSFGTRFGDVGGGLNSSFGEFSGVVPVSIHRNFLQSAFAMVPEPQTWAMMILGFGLVGGAMRRQKTLTKVRFQRKAAAA